MCISFEIIHTNQTREYENGFTAHGYSGLARRRVREGAWVGINPIIALEKLNMIGNLV
jgi:hypothetical protein